jgi:hypothetical protein
MAKNSTSNTRTKQWIVSDAARFNEYKISLENVINGKIDL